VEARRRRDDEGSNAYNMHIAFNHITIRQVISNDRERVKNALYLAA
jgi:hypothetical protein